MSEHEKIHHHHGCSCGCCDNEVEVVVDTNLTKDEHDFLHYLAHSGYLPVAQFVATSSKNDGFETIPLAPAFIQTKEDTMEQVKDIGELLKSLQRKGMLTLDYDLPLKGYDYKEYLESEVYIDFCEIVTILGKDEKFLSDTPSIELGSMALTEAGKQLMENCHH